VLYDAHMLILALETSCDETSAAVVRDGTEVLSNIIASSQESFAQSGGVIPEEAARKQVECVLPVIHQALEKADVKPEEIDALAVTCGPGLLVSLLVGTTTARTLASLWQKPLIGVHHTLGHLSSTWLDCMEEPTFPLLALSASGGHTDLWLRTSHTHGSLIGRTRDDAAGEAFDKGAQLLGLPYPGGPAIAQLATQGDESKHTFPVPLHDDDTLEYSFSGLKTSLKYLLRDTPPQNEQHRADIAASYQHAICLHLVERIEKALSRNSDVHEVHLVGGVSANIHLRCLVEERCAPLRVRMPQKIVYCTDNAAMIAAAAYFLHKECGEGAFGSFETEASLPLKNVMS